MADNSNNSSSSFVFEYDTGELVQAKTLALYNANLCATAKGIFATVKNPLGLLSNGKVESRYDWDRIKAFSESGNDAECYSGEPMTEMRKIDFSAIEAAQEKFNTIAQTISDFNDEIDRIIGVIIENVDPDLAEELETAIKDIEKEALKEYLDKGVAGAAIDPIQLYKLLSKYKDDPSILGLTDDQKAFFDYMIDTAETAIEYENMSDIEKKIQSCVVFGASVVDGVVQVGEEIVDGAVFIGGEAIGLGALVFCDADTRKMIVEGTFGFIDKDWSGDLYDDFVELSGLNKNIAYGPAHRVGLAVGKVTGDSLIAMIPGGKAAQVAVEAIRAAGASAQSTAGEVLEYREAEAGLAIVKKLVGAGIDKLPDGKAKEVIEVLQGAGEELADDLVDYYLKGETDNPTIKGFIEEHGADVVKAAVDVIVDKGKDVVKEDFKGEDKSAKQETGSTETKAEGKKEEPKKEKTAEEKFDESMEEGIKSDVKDAVVEEIAAEAKNAIFGPETGPTEPMDSNNNVRDVDYIG